MGSDHTTRGKYRSGPWSKVLLHNVYRCLNPSGVRCRVELVSRPRRASHQIITQQRASASASRFRSVRVDWRLKSCLISPHSCCSFLS